jgi:hypothetical protein
MAKHYDIIATWDDEAGVYVAQCDELGLVTEASTNEALVEKLEDLVPQLVALNRVAAPGETLTIGLVTKRDVKLALAA